MSEHTVNSFVDGFGPVIWVSEHVWHCNNAAIRAIEQGRESEALGILRALRFMLAQATGHDTPEIFPTPDAGPSNPEEDLPAF